MTDLPTSPHLATSDDAVGDAAYPIAGRFRLADGRLVWPRPLLAEDAPRLMDLCKRLSPSRAAASARPGGSRAVRQRPDAATSANQRAAARGSLGWR